jgi:hypothetical protein
MAGRRLPSLLLGVAAAALVLLAVVAAWRSQDGHLRRLEATLTRREAGWGDRFNRLEAALARREAPPQAEPPGSKAANSRELQPPTPADRPTNLALARIEARLSELGQRLEEGQAGRDQDDRRDGQIRRDLDRLRQEMETAVRASRQEGQELGAAVREILRLLRHLASRSGPREMMPVPVPIPVWPSGHEPRVGQGPDLLPVPGPVPSPAQVPGPTHPQPAPGRSNR